MSDENLKNILTRLKANDQTALKEVFDAYYLSVCHSIHRFIREKQTVEDLAQEVFIKVWRKRQQINVTSSFKAYLQRMGVNAAFSHLRKLKNKEKQEITAGHMQGLLSPSAEENYLENELEIKIKAAVRSLPPKCRMVFQLSRNEGFSYKEIAQKMGISVKTVDNQIGKSLRILRKHLNSYLEI